MKLRNSQIKIKRAFTTLNTRIEEIKNEDSGLKIQMMMTKKGHISSLSKQTSSKG